MPDFAKEILPVNIEEEMKQSYLDYAMSVIVGRALPDVRDGLKPVHRRVLFAMSELGVEWNRPYKKSARVVGDTIGKYHPHGESAVYDALVRMAQSFSMRVMLIDGQGNFGSVDGDSPAAMRYTEVRMARVAHELLADIDKETVDFVPNYDESEREPSVFPTRLPNLLINGSAGIAVGMATNVPPHNPGETVDACVAVLENPSITVDELIGILPGPDFPTAGIINGTAGVHEAYRTGRGRVHIRARTHVETLENGTRQAVIITELPYQVNKARLLEKIAELVKEKKIDGISELRDESDKDGMRVVIELKRGENAETLVNKLYQQTPLETVFGINLVALVDGQPRLLTLKQILEAFVRHRREVVTRRTLFDLRKARDRAHVLEGLAVALANIDEVIALIRASQSPAEAKAGLVARTWAPGAVRDMLARAGAETSRPDGLAEDRGLTDAGYRLTEEQAQAILDLRLHRLTGLEQDKILKEFDEILTRIRDFIEILTNPDRLRQVIKDELVELKERFGDQRRTEIRADRQGFDPADLVAPQDVVVTLSHEGYVKWQRVDSYQAQKRGGRGRTAATTKAEDFVERLFVANTHDTLLCFSSLGRVYWLKVYELPEAGRTARGKPIVNLLQHMGPQERISAVLPLKGFDQQGFVLLATARGLVKKTPLADYSRPRASGIIAIDLMEDDALVGVAVTDGDRDIMLASSNGKMVRFHESQVRPMGRVARGVIGMRLPREARVIALIVADDGLVLSATEHGYGKCTRIDEYPRKGRGGQGVISIQTSERNGPVVSALLMAGDEEMMLITNGGKLVRTRVEEVSVLGRNTQGVMLIRLGEGERLVGVGRVLDEEVGRVLDDEQEISTRRALAARGGNRSSMVARAFNFSAGPAALPLEVLERIREELTDFRGSGMSVMEMSHRGAVFEAVAREAEERLRRLLGIGEAYRVLFLQGGAQMQFSAVPLNLLPDDGSADYVDTGAWSAKAIQEAARYGRVNVVASSAEASYFHIPDEARWRRDPNAAYLHYTPNETIGGVEFHFVPEAGGVPLVADMSSTILSRPLDVSRFALIYAGAQKNMGIAGLTVVIVHDDLLGRARAESPTLLDYRVQAKAGSMANTAPTFAWYVAGLVFEWLEAQGGLATMAERNRRKAETLYRCIERSNFYASPVAEECRSWMNVPFTLADDALDPVFLEEAKAAGLAGLKGHRSVGGMRASLYNAMTQDGVDALVAFMEDFERRRG